MEKFSFDSFIREFDEISEEEIQEHLANLRHKFPTIEISDAGEVITYSDTLNNLMEIVIFESETFDGNSQSISEDEIMDVIY